MEKSVPVIARPKPYHRSLEGGRIYLWCACGLSRNQPYCDGSHLGSGIEPVRYRAAHGQEVLFCGCKQTATPPFCDGAHNNLPGAYALDDPDSASNRAIRQVTADQNGVALLDGGCYVLTPSRLPCQWQSGLSYAPVISGANGARFQAQYVLGLESGESPTVRFRDSHVIVFVFAGRGTLALAGRSFDITRHDAVAVRPDEGFVLAADLPLTIYVSACPGRPEPEFGLEKPEFFDVAYSKRVGRIDQARRTAMGERFFQVLIDESRGCEGAAHFIGEIPVSKAAPHRHLYEESLIVLRGEGMMWTESLRAPVAPGDIIFLPRKQPHSLQCTGTEPMQLAGVIAPGTNPGINY